jgi:hypothetical protein
MTKDTAKLTKELKAEYMALDVDGVMGSMLSALYDMQYQDLLISV